MDAEVHHANLILQAQNLVAALRIKLEEIEAGDKKAQRESKRTVMAFVETPFRSLIRLLFAVGDSRLAKIMQIYHSYRDFLLVSRCMITVVRC